MESESQSSSLADQLSKLAKLRAEGVLNDEDYRALKTKLIGLSDRDDVQLDRRGQSKGTTLYGGANQEHANSLLRNDRGGLLRKVAAIFVSGAVVIGVLLIAFFIKHDQARTELDSLVNPTPTLPARLIMPQALCEDSEVVSTAHELALQNNALSLFTRMTSKPDSKSKVIFSEAVVATDWNSELKRVTCEMSVRFNIDQSELLGFGLLGITSHSWNLIYAVQPNSQGSNTISVKLVQTE
jgi:putative oligomerization/nucleic acid binding protein